MSMSSLHFIGRRVARANVVAAALLLAACSGDSPSDPGPQAAQYATLVVNIGGLPVGANANVTVTGPGGFSRALSATTSLTQLSAGTYTVVVSDVTHDGSTYSAAPTSQSYQVAAGTTVSSTAVSYALATGGLSITLAGLPQSTQATIVVSGPDGYSKSVGTTTSIVGLKPGTYLIEAHEVQLPGSKYAASVALQQVEVVASPSPSVANVVYAIASGSLQVNINGLPTGAAAAVTVAGPGNYSTTVTGQTVIDNLTPGLYTVTASNVNAGVSLFTPSVPSQQVVVQASQQASVVNVTYASSGTAVDVQVNGLPSGVSGVVTVTGPNGYSRQLSGSQLLSSLTPGSYSIIASAVTVTCATYLPSPPSQTVTVLAGEGSIATITYAIGGGGVNFCIDGAYITQAVQTYDNSVPLIAGRNGLLRVFVRASTTNAAQPAVRARFYDQGGTLINTMTLSAPTASVPNLIDESMLGASWNAQIP